jgi:hypothetical protein
VVTAGLIELKKVKRVGRVERRWWRRDENLGKK